MNRRQMLKTGSAALAGMALPFSACTVSSDTKEKDKPFRIGINTSSISGYKLPVEQQIDLCAEAGFDSIELWIKDVHSYMDKGGKPQELASRIKNLGLQLENMIGFAPWMTGEAGMEEMKDEMELSAKLGSKYIAATCFGLEFFDKEAVSVHADAYHSLLEYGTDIGVYPLLELWGHRSLHRLSDLVSIAIEAKHPNAAFLLDFYHLYKGDNSFESLSLVNGKMLPVFHINDYPHSISQEQLKDIDRVFPGDGACPFSKILPILLNNGFNGTFSLELFNADYWQRYTVEELLAIGRKKVFNVIHPIFNFSPG